MAKNKSKRGSLIFVICMLSYALVFLCATAFGLDYFWNFIDAYEQSRPQNTVDNYMAQLTPQYVAERCDELIAQVDHNIQNEEVCAEVITEALRQGFTCAKKVKECTDTKQVYILRSGTEIIGQFQIEAVGQPSFGFTPWEITADSFDLSYLLTDTISVTTPHDYRVFVNGVELDQNKQTETGIHYTVLEEFYEKIDLPYQVSYAAGPCLGSISLQVTDPAGNPVTIDESTDMNQFLSFCSGEEQKDLSAFNKKFITRYVALLTSKNSNRYDNYNALVPYMNPGSDIATRTRDAVEGLASGRSNMDVVLSVTTNSCIRLDQDRYICDITYVVNSLRYVGWVKSTTNVKVLVVHTEDGLKADILITI